jgi:hypothetical protein
MHHRDPDFSESPVVPECSFNLRRQFSRWFENQTTEGAMLREQGQNRKRERGRFAGPGLRGPDKIFAC